MYALEDKPPLNIINLAKETRNSGVFAMLPLSTLLTSYPT